MDGLDVRLETPVDHIEYMAAWDLDAGLNTAHAHHAAIHPLPDERRSKRNIWTLNLLRNVILFVDPEFVCQVLKFTLAPSVANRTIERMLNQEKLQGVPPHPLYTSCPRVNNHPLGDRCCTGGHRLFHAFDVDDAHPTGLEPTQLSQVAKGGNVDAVLSGGLQNRRRVLSRDLSPINR